MIEKQTDGVFDIVATLLIIGLLIWLGLMMHAIDKREHLNAAQLLGKEPMPPHSFAINKNPQTP
jgi:hypothetical protein